MLDQITADILAAEGSADCIVGTYQDRAGPFKVFSDSLARDAYVRHVSKASDLGDMTHNGVTIPWARF